MFFAEQTSSSISWGKENYLNSLFCQLRRRSSEAVSNNHFLLAVISVIPRVHEFCLQMTFPGMPVEFYYVYLERVLWLVASALYFNNTPKSVQKDV